VRAVAGGSLSHHVQGGHPGCGSGKGHM
jgi:hypothetical protein